MEKKYISACLNALSTSISALYCWLLAGSKFSCSGRIKFRRKNVGPRCSSVSSVAAWGTRAAVARRSQRGTGLFFPSPGPRAAQLPATSDGQSYPILTSIFMMLKRMSISVYSLKKAPTSAFTPNLFRVRHYQIFIDRSFGQKRCLCLHQLRYLQIENSRCKLAPSPNIVFIDVPIAIDVKIRYLLCWCQGLGTAAARERLPVSSPAERWSRDSKLVLHCREQRSPDSHNNNNNINTALVLNTTEENSTTFYLRL